MIDILRVSMQWALTIIQVIFFAVLLAGGIIFYTEKFHKLFTTNKKIKGIIKEIIGE